MGNYNVGDMIRLSRIAKKMTQEELSEGVCSVETLSRIENGKHKVKSDTYRQLMEKMYQITEKNYAVCVSRDMELIEEREYFEDAMAKVSTIADTTEVPLDELRSQILALSSQTGISANEIADNVYNAISAGQKTGDAVNFVTNSTKLAKAGFADAGAALDVLTTILNAYGMEASEVTNVSDMLIQTQNLGKTTVAELSSSMGKVIPTANAYHVQLDQLCAGYAKMTANGVATAESTTYMNSMLVPASTCNEPKVCLLP